MDDRPNMTLGELIAALERVTEPLGHVEFDFCGYRPRGLASWRNVYADLAIGYSLGEGPTVEGLLETLRGAVGQEFVSYKSGRYRMSRDTRVWVGNIGDVGCTAVVGVREQEGFTVLETGYRVHVTMGRERALSTLQELANSRDVEVAHERADGVLCDLLIALGYADVVEAWRAVPKWYG